MNNWVRARRDATTVDRETLEIAQALQHGCQIAMLTNSGSLLFEALPQMLPDVHRVLGEGAHASFQFNALKPQTEVFERQLDRYRAPAVRAAFIDDCEQFVATARRAGMHGFRHSHAAELRSHLSELRLAPVEAIAGQPQTSNIASAGEGGRTH